MAGGIDASGLRALQALAQELWQRQPEWIDLDATVGELAWTWGAQHALAPAWTIRTWTDAGRVRAWGWIHRADQARAGAHPATLVWQLHPERPELLDEVLDWFEAEAAGVERNTSVRAANRDAAARLEARGYLRDPAAPFHLLLQRDLDGALPEPELPAGHRLATLRDHPDVAARVAVHRAAWQPSRVSEAAYADVMRTWPYRPELDFVVLAPDGDLAAYALGWLDPDGRVGEFEPVGTRPASRRLGLARAAGRFGLRRLREAGATRAIVACRGDDGYPIPARLYRSLGFRELSRQVVLRATCG